MQQEGSSNRRKYWLKKKRKRKKVVNTSIKNGIMIPVCSVMRRRGNIHECCGQWCGMFCYHDPRYVLVSTTTIIRWQEQIYIQKSILQCHLADASKMQRVVSHWHRADPRWGTHSYQKTLLHSRKENLRAPNERSGRALIFLWTGPTKINKRFYMSFLHLQS